MKLQEGEKKIYELPSRKEEALLFLADGKELWVKRYLQHGRYEVRGLLAIGGLGCVFGALDRWNYNHKVVIKTPYYMGDYCRPYIARSKEAFEQQIARLNKLYDMEKKHLIGFSNAGFDSIANLNDCFFDCSLDLCQPFRNAAGVQYFISTALREQVPYLVLKYIPGEMLKDVLDRKPLGQIKTLRLAKQTLMLLRYLHQHRVSKKGREFYYLLCDLKAENILATDEEYISLIDFGAVKIHWLDQQQTTLPIFVTDGYAAPEVYSGSLEFRDNPRIDKLFDIFTIGALMVHCLTGKHPYNFLTSYTPPQHDFHLSSYPKIDDAVKTVVAKATAKEKQDRYSDADKMLKDVWRALEKITS